MMECLLIINLDETKQLGTEEKVESQKNKKEEKEEDDDEKEKQGQEQVRYYKNVVFQMLEN